MVEGLLWFDDDPKRTLAEKVMRAVAAYWHKHGLSANVCLVHPSVLKHEIYIGGTRVAPWPTVLLHHFWVGREKT